MPRMLPRLTLPALVPLWLTACVMGPTSEVPRRVPPSRIVNPCDSITLPARLDDARRAQLADEIAAAPADAVWPIVLTEAAGVERAVRACKQARPG